MRREYTATVFIVEGGKTLLLFHKRLKCWMPPGGHLSENETPHEGAMREVLEETGLEVRLFDQEELVVDEKHARSIPRPYICLLEDEEDHQHVDFVFVGRPVKGELVENKDETNGIQWFSAEELATIEMLADARQIAKKLLNEKSTIFCSDKSTRGENDHVSGGRVGTAQAV